MAERSRRQVKKNQDLQRILYLEKERSRMRMIRKIVKKPSITRTDEEIKILEEAPDLVVQIQNNIKKLKCVKEREKVIIDEPEVLSEKCTELAKALKESSCTVVYTGAGISTSAQIPDYRGPDGVWTLLQKGKEIKMKDLSLAEPTFTHMAIKQLHKEGLISHIVSQNCDGLHLRSGLPKVALSELHGNMFIEVCPKCKPLKQYVRLFDVTERTGLHRHKTGRFCSKCDSELKDTIVHFGEKGTLPWPMNWKGAVKAASKADLILCLGTSLKVLRRYPGLWQTDKPHDKRPKLFIVNLQWTPKDPQATLKIHGKCDEVMKLVTTFLGIEVPTYKKQNDPIFKIAVPLLPHEMPTTTRLHLMRTKTESTDNSDVVDCKENLNHIKATLKNELENCSNSTELLRDLDLKLNFQPHVELTDITSTNTLLKLNVEQIDSRTYFIKEENEQEMPRTNSGLSGWFGKGCAKWKRQRRRTISSCKKLKAEKDKVDSSA
ncbi:NAD-dependent protein deacetylase sirtuin-7 like protein [Argiope bruennichi]|uniref:protein acetyllysine N-acetyltransferase n=1 Tax=Argiope bruennichi TaxID=94029 RepID=A0A8T0ENQ7_ARGBR|nr:NAD-dependent protein deacetylase sirtuin-7 like protein [Argiope bruennichi]